MSEKSWNIHRSKTSLSQQFGRDLMQTQRSMHCDQKKRPADVGAVLAALLCHWCTDDSARRKLDSSRRLAKCRAWFEQLAKALSQHSQAESGQWHRGGSSRNLLSGFIF